MRAVFVPLSRLHKDLDLTGKANTILLAAGNGERVLKRSFTLADLGLKLRTLDEREEISVESDGALISDALARSAHLTASNLLLNDAPVFTYLANRIRLGDREMKIEVRLGKTLP